MSEIIFGGDFLLEAQESAERMRALAKKRGVAVSKVLLECGLNKSLMHDVQTRNAYPTADKIAKIASYFDVSVDYLLGRTDTKSPVEIPSKKKDHCNNQCKQEGGIELNCVTREERDLLKQLTSVFKELLNCGGYNPHGDPYYDTMRSFDEKKIKLVDEKLTELALTRETLHEWTVSNFAQPPTEHQLKEIFSFYMEHACESSYTKGIGFYELETAINDYAYSREERLHKKRGDVEKLAAAVHELESIEDGSVPHDPVVD